MCASYGTRWRARGDRSPRATPRRPLRFLYIGERAAQARALGCHCSCFLLRFASLFRDAFRLCRHSAFVFAGSLAFCSTLPAFCSCLCSTSVSSLPRLRLSLVACESYTTNYTATGTKLNISVEKPIRIPIG